MHVPIGLGPATPYFSVSDAERFASFLAQGLGGTEPL